MMNVWVVGWMDDVFVKDVFKYINKLAGKYY